MTQHLIEPLKLALPPDWTGPARARQDGAAASRPRTVVARACARWTGLWVAVGALALLAGVGAAAPAQAQTGAMEVAADVRMAQEAAPMRAAAEAFVARAMAGEREATLALLSPALVERMGRDNAARVLDAQILPFFQRGRQVGRSTTVTRTTDAQGSRGFAFYQWLEPADGGAPRPYTLYVVREQGRLVVANIVPDRLVEGRHR